jgi:hypothetical protein
MGRTAEVYSNSTRTDGHSEYGEQKNSTAEEHQAALRPGPKLSRSKGGNTHRMGLLSAQRDSLATRLLINSKLSMKFKRK